MKRIISTLKFTLWTMLACIFFMACTENDLVEPNEAGNPIRLFVSGPEDSANNAGRAVKEEFTNDDGIHICTTFTLNDKTEKKAYSFLKCDNGNWVETGTETFNWPWNAVSASFVAYYLPKAGDYQNSDKLSEDNGKITFPLSTLSQNDAEPLMATHADVTAGGSVYLQFNHLFSKLTFTDLGEEATENEELRLIVPQSNDSWSITLSNNELKEESAVADEYIAGKVSSSKDVTFLIPAIGKGSKITLAKKNMSTLHTLTLPETLTNGLETGKHYRISVTNLFDNFVSDDIEEGWNEDNSVTFLNAEEIGGYLKGVSEGEDYSVIREGKTIKILVTYKEGDDHIVAQIRDVNFNNIPFELPEKDLTNVKFNGNNHYIKNVTLEGVKTGTGYVYKAIFGENNGEMSNLIIENVKTEVGEAETCLGILVGRNKGSLSNIRIKGEISLTASSNSQYIGTLTGYNDKNITNCSVTGKLTMEVAHEGSNLTNAGGFTGYTTTGTIKNCRVEVESGSGITISGNCSSNILAGGFTGQNTSGATITGCSTNLPVNITKQGNVYAGGFTGMSSSSSNLTNCTAIGNITIPQGANAETMIAGGFVGTLGECTLNDCAAIGNLSGTINAGTKVGGFAGWADKSTNGTTIQYSSATGEVPENAGGMIGTIAEACTINIENSFCINGSSFIQTGTATITDCHIKGKVPGQEEESNFTPSDTKWTNTPPIYGDNIYYLKRGTND